MCVYTLSYLVVAGGTCTMAATSLLLSTGVLALADVSVSDVGLSVEEDLIALADFLENLPPLDVNDVVPLPDFDVGEFVGVSVGETLSNSIASWESENSSTAAED